MPSFGLISIIYWSHLLLPVYIYLLGCFSCHDGGLPLVIIMVMCMMCGCLFVGECRLCGKSCGLFARILPKVFFKRKWKKIFRLPLLFQNFLWTFWFQYLVVFHLKAGPFLRYCRLMFWQASRFFVPYVTPFTFRNISENKCSFHQNWFKTYTSILGKTSVKKYVSKWYRIFRKPDLVLLMG